jgi:hypothetical protein
LNVIAATKHVAGAVTAKVGEIRSDWRMRQEEELALDVSRPLEERIEHAKRAVAERSEHYRLEQERARHIEWLANTKPVEYARETRDKVAEVSGITKAKQVIGEKSHEFAEEVREAKHTYGMALERAKDAAVGKAHAVKDYIEDTGEWMKKGIFFAEGKIEKAFGFKPRHPLPDDEDQDLPRATPQQYEYDVRA